MQEEDFPCSTEELELIFDGLDAAGTGQLSTEEFTAGLCKCQHAASKQPGLIRDMAPAGEPETLPLLGGIRWPKKRPHARVSAYGWHGEGSYCAEAACRSHGVGSVGVWALLPPWLGTEGLGYLLAGQFLSSQKTTRNHRRRKTASRRVRLALPSPALDGANSEEQRHFAAFMEQLGTDNVSDE